MAYELVMNVLCLRAPKCNQNENPASLPVDRTRDGEPFIVP